MIHKRYRKVREGTDTFILKNDSDKFVKYDRTSCYKENTELRGAYHNGWMYVMGESPTEPDVLYMRATKVGKTPITGLSLTKTSLTYTGKQQTVAVSEVNAGGTTVQRSGYTVSGTSAVNAGKYSVTVKAKGDSGYTGSAVASYRILKGKTSFKVKPATKKLSKNKLKKKAATIQLKISSLTVGSAKPAFAIKSVSGGMKKNVSINPSTGKLKIKKNTKACKIKVAVKSKATANRKALTKTCTIVVR